ncbi:MAG: M14 family zinc carboxypeptidase [Planctomycetota bacterium]
MKSYKKNLIAALIYACFLALTGCQMGAKDPYAPVIATPQRIFCETLGHSVQNRPIKLITLGYGPDTVLIIATIHGNEDAGTPLVYRLINHLKALPKLLDGRTVMIVPLANPDGRALRTRHNATGVDLNRNFPAANRVNNAVNGIGGLTEPESTILHDLILTRPPARIVTIHQPLYCLDYDGPGEKLAQVMAQYCTLPVKKLGSRPGSLGSFAGVEQSIPIITMELAKEDSGLTDGQLWTRYGHALLAAITYPAHPY